MTAATLAAVAALAPADLPTPAKLTVTIGDDGQSMAAELRTADDMRVWAAACGLDVVEFPHRVGSTSRAFLSARGRWDGVHVWLTADVVVREMAVAR